MSVSSAVSSTPPLYSDCTVAITPPLPELAPYRILSKMHSSFVTPTRSACTTRQHDRVQLRCERHCIRRAKSMHPSVGGRVVDVSTRTASRVPRRQATCPAVDKRTCRVWRSQMTEQPCTGRIRLSYTRRNSTICLPKSTSSDTRASAEPPDPMPLLALYTGGAGARQHADGLVLALASRMASSAKPRNTTQRQHPHERHTNTNQDELTNTHTSTTKRLAEQETDVRQRVPKFDRAGRW